MPVSKQIRVEARNHYGKGLRKGDFLTLPRGISGCVESMDEKQSYIHITLVGGTKGRLPIGSEINVTREVPTEDEENNHQLVYIFRKVDELTKSSKATMTNQLKKLNDSFKEGMAKGYLNPFDLDLAASTKLAEMEWALWEHVRSDVERLVEKGDGREFATLRALMGTRDYVQRMLTGRYSRALSRSTNVISNLEEDMQRQVWVEFLDDTKYWGAEELWEKIGTVL